MGFYLYVYVYMYMCVGTNAVYLGKHGCLTVFPKLLEGVAKRNYVILKLVHAHTCTCTMYIHTCTCMLYFTVETNRFEVY